MSMHTTDWESLCVLFSVLQRQLQDGVYSWPPLLCCCCIPSVRIRSREREKAKGGVGIMEMEEERSYSIWLLWELNLSGRTPQAGFSFVLFFGWFQMAVWGAHWASFERKHCQDTRNIIPTPVKFLDSWPQLYTLVKKQNTKSHILQDTLLSNLMTNDTHLVASAMSYGYHCVSLSTEAFRHCKCRIRLTTQQCQLSQTKIVETSISG